MTLKSILSTAFVVTLLATGSLKAEEPKVMTSREMMKPGHTAEDHKMMDGVEEKSNERGGARPEFGNNYSTDPKTVKGANVNFYDVWTIQNGLFQDAAEIFREGVAMDLILMDCKDYCDNNPEKCGAIDPGAIAGYKNLGLNALPGDRKEFLKCFNKGLLRRQDSFHDTDIRNDICNLACSGKGFMHEDSCQDPQRLRQCMLVCCPFGEWTIKNCLASNGGKHCSDVK